MIDDEFGSIKAMLAGLKAEATAHFSNGWAWLVLDCGRLRILSLHDADTPVVRQAMQPLLTLDVWEHAYYLDYRNDRARFAESLLGNLVNWEFVEANLDGRGFARADQRF
jgi:Fe-Mn family superoxide dismutase